MNNKISGIVIGTALGICGLSTTAQASLIDIGGGLIYDDVLNITWLQNANLAATETFGVAGIEDGSNPDLPAGGMTWDTAKAWIAAMNQNNYLGFNTWRLPSVTPLNGVSFNYAANTNGSADKGFNITAPGTIYAGSDANELAHLFHNTLGNRGYCAIEDGPANTDTCTHPTPDNYWQWGLVNTGPFINFTTDRYWSGTQSTADDRRAFDFDFAFGQVGTGLKDGRFIAFAVLDGNASATAVPVPAAIWLFGSGLIGLVAVGRRRVF